MADASASGRVPILCGGTGLYFAALTEGLSDIPAIPGAAREEARRLLAELGPAALHARLAHRPGDGRDAPPHRQSAHRAGP
jgi:tRNA dimethylallyltransferase